MNQETALTIITICIVIITVFLLIGLFFYIQLMAKIITLLNSSKHIIKDLRDVSRTVKEESAHVIKTVRDITIETKEKFNTFNFIIDKVNENIYMLSSLMKGIRASINHFIKNKEKEEE